MVLSIVKANMVHGVQCSQYLYDKWVMFKEVSKTVPHAHSVGY
jgi:hypothetical protein